MFAAVELGGALPDALLEVRREREVLEQHRDLADHGEHQQRQHVPSEEASEPVAEGQPEPAENDGEHDRHVRNEYGEPIGNVVVAALWLRIDGSQRPARKIAANAQNQPMSMRLPDEYEPLFVRYTKPLSATAKASRPGEQQRPARPARTTPVACGGSTRTAGS